MTDQYEITQATESGGLLRRVRVNDGPWFVRVGEESDLARLTRERDELRFDIGVAMTAIKDGDAAAAYQALEIALSRQRR